MHYRKKTVLMIISLLLCFPITALAGGKTGFYLGAGVGRMDVKDTVSDGDDFSAYDAGYKIIAGYNFGKIPLLDLALEGSYVASGFLKTPTALLWMLETYGVTPDKTVITTCDTGVAAADVFFVLRYLGFSDVRVHDEAWVNWSRTR